ncbi:hypothetical protein H6F88_13565 [Oculatella sp. FACHB-28]|uniref:hypothetical protein n=1 Tax=Cyanophyceae TaxID=3028117 RepID=UPI001687ECBF|nr:MULTISPECIES: hypothetical protein [Cyanophyceae]MBD2057031.1 hypothetical protein [Oculatella sp. FACHB-28]MBD2067193.1 hypothetical protein [Leptolyngbya sp. FACHB-671]
MKHSIFFPNHTSWLNALKISIPGYLCGVGVFAFSFWQYAFISIVLATAQGTNPLGILIIDLLALLAGIAWYFLLILIFSLLLRLLWSNPPEWLKPSMHWFRVLYDFNVIIFATLPIFLIFLAGVAANESIDLMKSASYQLHLEKVLLNFSWLWVIAAAYLYQIEFVVKNRRKVKKC